MPTDETPAATPSETIDRIIADLNDWRGAALARVRRLVHEALPAVVEDVKWRGVPVWSCEGILCTGETYRAVVKLTFPKGASLPDPSGLFNASLEGNVRRAIDIHDGEEPEGEALKALLLAAAAENGRRAKAKTRTR